MPCSISRLPACASVMFSVSASHSSALNVSATSMTCAFCLRPTFKAQVGEYLWNTHAKFVQIGPIVESRPLAPWLPTLNRMPHEHLNFFARKVLSHFKTHEVPGCIAGECKELSGILLDCFRS